jgi:hypothetical protein
VLLSGTSHSLFRNSLDHSPTQRELEILCYTLSVARTNLEFTAPVEIFINHFRKMKNLTSSNWIKAKGFLFLSLGLLSVTVLLFEHPTFQMAVLLTIAVWSFCRFYFFAFYVLEHYVDPSYRFTGLISFARYVVSRKQHEASGTDDKS